MPSYAGVSANVASLILPPSAVSGVSWASLFTSGGNAGAVWDPRELGEMSSSITGGTFGVSIGDTVGFVMDQARGGTAALGANQITNSTFNSGTTDWSTTGAGSISASSGVATISHGGIVGNGAITAAGVQNNRSYLVTVVVVGSSGSGTWEIGANGGLRVPLDGSAGTKTLVITAGTSGSGILGILSQSATVGSIQIDTITLQELPGIHMVAPSDARRATLVDYNAGSVPSLYANGAHGYASSAALDLSGSDEVTVIMQVRSLSDVGTQMFLESSASWDASLGTFAVIRTTTYGARSRGSNAASATSLSPFNQPDSALLVIRSKIGADYLELLRNRVQISATGGDQGPGNFTSQIINWMGRAVSAAFSLGAVAEFGTAAIIGGALSTELYDMMVAKAAYA